MKPKPRPWCYVGSVLKAAEGGPLKRYLQYAIEQLGLKVSFGPSCYIGHINVYIQGDQRKRRSVEKILHLR